MPDRYPGRDWQPRFPVGYVPRETPALSMGPNPEQMELARRSSGAMSARVREGDEMRRKKARVDAKTARRAGGDAGFTPPGKGLAVPRPRPKPPHSRRREGALPARLLAVLVREPVALTSNDLYRAVESYPSAVTGALAYLKSEEAPALRWAPGVAIGRNRKPLTLYWHARHDAAVRAALNLPAAAASESEDADAKSL